MSPDEPTPGDLRRLLHDAVSDVVPTPGLERIRQRAHRPARTGRRTRTWWVAGAAAAAVIVVVGGISALNRSAQPDSAPGVTSGGAASTGPTTHQVLGIYYVGDTPQGPRLYREFRRLTVPLSGSRVGAAVTAALGDPTDPDYRTSWPSGTTVARTRVPASGPVTVSLSNSGADLAKRPAGMSAREATESVQQLVYTTQAALQARRPVRFEVGDHDTETLLGVDVSEPVAEQDQLSVLALVSISDPAEGATVRGSFRARGVASSFEANVPWEITRHGWLVKRGYSTADGWADRLYPWQSAKIDVSRLAPGTYTFTAMTDDASEGEGFGPTKDTRTFVVRR